MMLDGPRPSVFARLPETEVPLAALGDACLCITTGIEGASYRPLGAAMAVDAAGMRVGALSSGCIDEDVAHHATEALRSGIGRTLRYGRGSEFFDLQLPCGGGLEVMLIPRPAPEVLARAAARLAAREPATLIVGWDGTVAENGTEGLHLTLLPRLRIVVFGNGPEPLALAAIAAAAGQQVELHEDWPDGLICDERTAVAAFFHDHDRELPILRNALASPAFYVGAQGSLQARAARADVLGPIAARLADPFGLVHAKDPQTLAAGVLAQILGLGAARD